MAAVNVAAAVPSAVAYVHNRERERESELTDLNQILILQTHPFHQSRRLTSDTVLELREPTFRPLLPPDKDVNVHVSTASLDLRIRYEYC